MGARGLSSSKKYTFFLLTRALMCWLSFIKLREILVGIIVGLFLTILFWSGDRYATQPKTGSDSGKFNLRLGLLLWSFFFSLGRALNQRKAEHKEPLDGRLGCFSFKSQKLKVKKIFRIPSAAGGLLVCWDNHVHKQKFPCCCSQNPDVKNNCFSSAQTNCF